MRSLRLPPSPLRRSRVPKGQSVGQSVKELNVHLIVSFLRKIPRQKYPNHQNLQNQSRKRLLRKNRQSPLNGGGTARKTGSRA